MGLEVEIPVRVHRLPVDEHIQVYKPVNVNLM